MYPGGTIPAGRTKPPGASHSGSGTGGGCGSSGGGGGGGGSSGPGSGSGTSHGGGDPSSQRGRAADARKGNAPATSRTIATMVSSVRLRRRATTGREPRPHDGSLRVRG